MIGRKLGPYEVLAKLGAGGMGEVYRARDIRLKRDVAIKVLPDTFITDRSRVARFQREAELLATLNHQNIAHIHGLEESGSALALVLELVEGPTLADRIALGALPLNEALAIARQLADALDAAHERGIVHRDLKPSNIKVTPAGIVKVLDFGLAKATSDEAEAPDLADSPTITAGATRAGVIIGTAAYMSPEQARGRAVDKRTDIWAFGCVLYELLTGQRAMRGDTVSDILASVLTDEPDWSRVPATTPPRVVALLQRCLTKDPRDRQRDIGDVRFELKEPVSGPAVGPSSQPRPKSVARRVAVAAVVLAALGGLAYTVWPRATPVEAWVNPLANAQFTRITDFPGTETHASISPDGRFVAFLSDRDGPMHVWLTQVGSGRFTDLTRAMPSIAYNYALRSVGFSGDGTEVWTAERNQTRLLPLIGGELRPFLGGNAVHPSWSPDGASLVYNRAVDGDPIYIADRSGGNAREIFKVQPGIHNHNPIWSADGEWIYFVHGDPDGEKMDISRIRPSGGPPEIVTDHGAPVNFVTPLDARTLLFVAPAEDRTGPWLWSLDVPSRQTRRVTTGVEQYLSVAASADGRRIVATVANGSASLWTVPVLDRVADERDVKPFPVPSVRALGPRIHSGTLFYLSTRGAGDGLWRAEKGQTSEIWKGSDGPLGEPAALSRDGRRVAIMTRRGGRGRVTVMNADGSDSRDVSSAVDVRGVVDWSPEGTSIVAGGIDADGYGLFVLPLDGGTATRLTKGLANSPAWSPDDSLIVYGGPNVGGRQQVLGVRRDGTAVPLPSIYVPGPAARAAQQSYRFMPDGKTLVYMPPLTATKEFWAFNISTGMTRRIVSLNTHDEIRAFDITADGTQIVFDRLRENSDIVLIERAASK
jgi:serine/threonine protein kinase/Tol biopolymer transport system component